jgi:hypothetical protein
MVDPWHRAGAVSGVGLSVADTTVRALRAGADMVMFNTTPGSPTTADQFDATVAALTSAVENGAVGHSRLVSAASADLEARGVHACS